MEMSVELKLRKIIPRLIEELSSKKVLSYEWIMREYGVSPATAWRYAKQIALKFPDNIDYRRGMLFLKKPFSEEDIPIELRYEAQKKTIKTLNEALKKEREIKRKLRENHLTHLEKALLEEDLEQVKNIIENMKKALEE